MEAGDALVCFAVECVGEDGKEGLEFRVEEVVAEGGAEAGVVGEGGEELEEGAGEGELRGGEGIDEGEEDGGSGGGRGGGGRRGGGGGIDRSAFREGRDGVGEGEGREGFRGVVSVEGEGEEEEEEGGIHEATVLFECPAREEVERLEEEVGEGEGAEEVEYACYHHMRIRISDGAWEEGRAFEDGEDGVVENVVGEGPGEERQKGRVGGGKGARVEETTREVGRRAVVGRKAEVKEEKSLEMEEEAGVGGGEEEGEAGVEGGEEEGEVRG